jgi:hypothetical protein
MCFEEISVLQLLLENWKKVSTRIDVHAVVLEDEFEVVVVGIVPLVLGKHRLRLLHVMLR